MLAGNPLDGYSLEGVRRREPSLPAHRREVEAEISWFLAENGNNIQILCSNFQVLPCQLDAGDARAGASISRSPVCEFGQVAHDLWAAAAICFNLSPQRHLYD